MRSGYRLPVIGAVLAVLLAVACTRDEGANPAAVDPDASAPDGVLDAAPSDGAVDADAELPLGAPGALCYFAIQGGKIYRCPPGFEDCLPFLTDVNVETESFCVKKIVVGDGEPCNDPGRQPPTDSIFRMCDAGLVCDAAQLVCHPPVTADAGPDSGP
jgi:hypothetical protein